MKVTHLTSVHRRHDIRIFYKECKSLMRAGYEVYLVVADGKGNEKIDGIQVIDVGLKQRSRLLRWFITIPAVYRAGKKTNADVYHFHDPELLFVGWILHLKGKKIFYDVHEDTRMQILSKKWIPFIIRKIVSLVFGFFEDRFAGSFDVTFCATETISQRFSKIQKNNIVLNNYPLSQELASPISSWKEKEKAVCFVGGISKQRGIVEMVRAVEKANVKLILAGRFHYDHEREQIVKLPGWRQVEELGFIDRTGVKEVLKRSFAGILLSHPSPNGLKSKPNKLFEYMSAGIPVITSRFPLRQEIIEGNECGICVDPFDINEIAEAIKWLFQNPEKAKTMGENGRNAVLKKYSWDTEEHKLFRVYNDSDEKNGNSLTSLSSSSITQGME